MWYMRQCKFYTGACSTCASTVPLRECQVSLRITDPSSGAGVSLADLTKIRAHVAYAPLPGDFSVTFASKFVSTGKVSGQSVDWTMFYG